MQKNFWRIIFLILIILISSIIFGFSSQDGEKSGGISKTIITKIADIIQVNESNREHFIVKGEKVIRKIAHFAIYTALGLVTMAFMFTFNMTKLKQSIITIIFGFVYASSDELHQLFISGRNGSFKDVLLDTSGVCFGIFLAIIIVFIINKVKNNIENEKIVV